MKRSFLILHGLGNHRPATHWQSWLARSLEARGETVRYPQLPDPDRPDRSRWLEEFGAEYARLGSRERVIICHSLSCFLWFAAVADELLDQPADRVLLAAPPGPSVISETPGFAGIPETASLHRSARHPIRLVASDDDPYCREGPAASIYGAPLALDSETIPGAGHLSIADGFGPWPGVLDWCLDGAVRISEAARHGHKDGEGTDTTQPRSTQSQRVR